MRTPYLPTKGFGKQEIIQCVGAWSINKTLKWALLVTRMYFGEASVRMKNIMSTCCSTNSNEVFYFKKRLLINVCYFECVFTWPSGATESSFSLRLNTWGKWTQLHGYFSPAASDLFILGSSSTLYLSVLLFSYYTLQSSHYVLSYLLWQTQVEDTILLLSWTY